MIRFEDPPKLARRGIWMERLSPLLDHPDRWAVVFEGKHSTVCVAVHRLRRRHKISYPDGRWDFRASQGKVYAKYLGEDDEAQA